MSLRGRFSSWYRYFRGRTPWESDVPKPHMIELLMESGLKPGKVLDLGCGSGANLVGLAHMGWTGLGIDHVQIALDRAGRMIEEAGVGNQIKLLRGDIRELAVLPTEPPYDLILDLGCSHTISYDDYEEYIEIVGKLLRYDGSYFLFAYEQGELKKGLGLDPSFVADAAGDFFDLFKSFPGQRATRKSNWYHFTRK